MTEPSAAKKPHSQKCRRTIQVKVSMTKEEFAHLKEQAYHTRKRRQDFIRALVAGSKLKAAVVIPREIYRDISGMANNINQLAMKANSGAPIPLAALNEMRDSFKEMARCLYSRSTTER